MKKGIFQSLIIMICSLSIAINAIPIRSYATQPANIGAAEFVSSMKTGWNLGNSLDSHYGEPNGEAKLGQETIWGNPRVSKELIDYVKAQGFDVIRVPVTWFVHTYRDANGVIHINQEWLARVHEVVDYCISDGLYVILNTHHDGTLFHCGVSAADFNQVKADASSIWAEISASFSGYDQHLIFESFNEVDNLAASWSFRQEAANQMNELNQIFLNTVRSSGGGNSERLLMVPTLLDQSGSNYQNAFVLPKDTISNKLIVTVHIYSQVFDQTLDTTFSDLAAFSRSIGAPIIIGEWGTTGKFSPPQYRGIHASNYIARAGKFGIKCIYWDNGSNYAIIDRKSLSSNSDMIAAIMNPTEYVSDSAYVLSDFSNYIYKTINQTTGEMRDDKHWGTVLVNTDGNGTFAVPAGKTSIYVGLVARDNMSDQRIHYLYFFDAAGNIVGKINDSYGFLEKTTDIPAKAAYARIGINNSYSKTSEKEYKKAVENGNLSLIINLY
jgi:aryl-phospho-beta-D-glucosidase BglC (GH1 family)